MSKIIDLEMSDEEYLQLIAQGRDLVSEKLYESQLAKLCKLLEASNQPRKASGETVSTEACEHFYNYLVQHQSRTRR